MTYLGEAKVDKDTLSSTWVVKEIARNESVKVLKDLKGNEVVVIRLT